MVTGSGDYMVTGSGDYMVTAFGYYMVNACRITLFVSVKINSYGSDIVAGWRG